MNVIGMPSQAGGLSDSANGAGRTPQVVDQANAFAKVAEGIARNLQASVASDAQHGMPAVDMELDANGVGIAPFLVAAMAAESAEDAPSNRDDEPVELLNLSSFAPHWDMNAALVVQPLRNAQMLDAWVQQQGGLAQTNRDSAGGDALDAGVAIRPLTGVSQSDGPARALESQQMKWAVQAAAQQTTTTMAGIIAHALPDGAGSVQWYATADAIARSMDSVEVVAPRVVPAHGAAAAAQPLMQALSQRIQVQQSQGQDVATVRLDPPQFGTLEVRIQQDASGGLQVTFNASNAEVGRQLASLAEGLRQELQARTSGEASVVVHSRPSGSAGGQSEQSGARSQAAWAEDEEAIGQALQAWVKTESALS